MIILKKKSSNVDVVYWFKLFKIIFFFKVLGWYFIVGYSRVYIVRIFFFLKIWWYDIMFILNKKKNKKEVIENKIGWKLVKNINCFF